MRKIDEYMPRLLYFFLLLFLSLTVSAGDLNGIRRALEQSGKAQVQEKVYIHTDNECYFVGDTLWYKAYVVRADQLTPTDMSRILYVELLSPDGLLLRVARLYTLDAKLQYRSSTI